VRSPKASVARRAFVAQFTLTLSLIAACTGDAPAPTEPGGPVPTPSVVDVAYCRGAEPAWVAFQDGDGAWTRSQPTASGAYTIFHHDFASNRGGLATAVQFASGLTSLTIRYGVPAELETFSDTSFGQCSSEALTRASGTVAGLDTNDVALVSSGFAVRDFVFPETGGEFELRGLLAGPQEILVMRGTRVNGLTPVTGMILRRIPSLAEGATIPAFDFRSAEVFQPEVHTVTFAGLAGEGITAFTGLRTAHSDNVVTFLTGAANATTRPFYSIPESRLEPGDLQRVGASTAPVANVIRSSAVYFRSPADRTLTFGAVPVAPVLTVVASTPTLRLRAFFAAQADYDRFAAINFQQGQNTLVSVSMTRAYSELAAAGYDLVVPELSAVQGFDARWALREGSTVLWTSSRIGGTLGLGPNAVPVDGATMRGASDAGFITP
jgi:hypothetical protein